MEEHRRDSEEREQRVENAVMKTDRLELTMRRAQLEEMAKEASSLIQQSLSESVFVLV